MQFHNDKEKILIVDFGSQVTKLIARRVRDLGVFSEIITPQQVKIKKFDKNTKGIILSGGPSTVTKTRFQIVIEISKLLLNSCSEKICGSHSTIHTMP